MPKPLVAAADAAAPPATHRLFFAVVPDGAATQRLVELTARLRHDLALGGRPTGADRLHATLCFLGDFPALPQTLVAQAGRAAAGVALAPFDVAFDTLASFPRPRRSPLVLRGGDGLAGLHGLQRALRQALDAAGLALPPERPYAPHLTLLYDDQRVAARAVAPIGWPVREFVLVLSHIGQRRHVVLGRWPLRAPA